jgi:hypothetical protein
LLVVFVICRCRREGGCKTVQIVSGAKPKGSNNSFRKCPNISTTPITAMGCRQCLPLSVVQLKGKHCRKPHCRNGVVDMFGQYIQCRLSMALGVGDVSGYTSYIYSEDLYGYISRFLRVFIQNGDMYLTQNVIDGPC